MPETEAGRMALILWRLQKIEELHDRESKWRRQVTAGIVVALCLPILQIVLHGIESGAW